MWHVGSVRQPVLHYSAQILAQFSLLLPLTVWYYATRAFDQHEHIFYPAMVNTVFAFDQHEHLSYTAMVNTVFRTPQQRKPQPATEVTLWVHPFVKAELKRLAELDGLSVSKTGATLLEDALHQKIHVRQAILFEPMIERAIAKQMQGMSNRLAWLLVRIAFDVGQIRGVATNILGRQQGVNEEILKTILQESSKAAKMSITRRTPQLTELMEVLEQWIQDEGRKTEWQS